MNNPLSRGVRSSVMSYITLSLTTILCITLISIFISFWVTELADQDAQAINLSGSMRMQTYQIGLALERKQHQQALQAIEKLDDTWHNPLFAQQHSELAENLESNSALSRYYSDAFLNWRDQVKPIVIKALDMGAASHTIAPLLEHQVMLTDRFVTEIQREAERKILNLRSFQLIVLFITIFVGCLIFYLLKERIEKPLTLLTESADKIGKGNFHQHIDIDGEDELALLSATFNRMSQSIAESYAQLEERVESRTRELKQNNIALDFLFNTAHKILEAPSKTMDFKEVLEDLSEILGTPSLELCLFTEAGDRPYIQLVSENRPEGKCERVSCRECRPNERGEIQTLSFEGEKRFPIAMENRHYGVIDLKYGATTELAEWKQSLVQSVANQFAIVLSLGEQKAKDNRFAMLNERTVIARELHDSLAQELSYLQIQVTRLQKFMDKGDGNSQQLVVDELREGLSSAYRRLRELLTTFRLKVDDGGLIAALEHTVSELRERSSMNVSLTYQLLDVPLSPSEEIHLLQIVREAGQNAVHHSQGSTVEITLKQSSDKRIHLEISDNGVGIPESPEKLNHYGLAIMNERSRSLGGEINITRGDTCGTTVSFSFTPTIERALINASTIHTSP